MLTCLLNPALPIRLRYSTQSPIPSSSPEIRGLLVILFARLSLATCHFRLTSFLSYSSALFCTLEIHNCFPFNRLRTLCAKHPGGGIGSERKTSSFTLTPC